MQGLFFPKLKDEKPAIGRRGSQALPFFNKNGAAMKSENSARPNPYSFGSKSKASFFRWPKFSS
ncbi:hypothetical protein EG328_002697 [Venturia inaequalis]|uniref:Uncharacterized protein n=1 Tax=Venturia inaequalis TaxID=5025 RepID=A0A8H3UV84_VENIN|nr:hypothetical protein EG328_002697 [Venturia inaequalis]KAE9987136.1 hypothetical protein EG327_003997 [Venturia inaequalis]RDI77704.1 Acetamidase [Venturia inaequalis]